MSEQNEPDEGVIGRAQEVLTGTQNGSITGIICVCFLSNGNINVQVAGHEPLVVRLGSLVVASDALKLLETQQHAERARATQWGPGGTTHN